jgi:single-stranded-DNA-specific exonuclease
LKELGYNFEISIESRKHGYGLTKNVIDKYADLGYDMLITADFGIQQYKEVEYAYSKGFKKVIVIDHHTIIPELVPKCDCVINPKFNGSDYPYYSLSAGATCYKLFKDYYEFLGLQFDKSKDLLRMAAISNIADMVSLQNGTWELTKQGLQMLHLAKDKLLKVQLEKQLKYKSRLTELDVAFGVAPVIGSVSRVADPVEYTVPFVLGDLSKYEDMLELNKLRKQIQQTAIEKAISEIKNSQLLFGKVKDIIFYVSEDIPDGVCGLVASGLTKEFNKPAVVMNVRGDGNVLGGSGRSVGSFNLLEALNRYPKWLSCAGHSMALGVSINKSNLEDLLNSVALTDYIEEHKHELESKTQYYKINLDEVPFYFDTLQQYAPFGQGNPRPKFYSENVEIERYYKYESTGFTNLKLNQIADSWGCWIDQTIEVQAMVFTPFEFSLGDVIDIVYYIEDSNKIVIEAIRKVELYEDNDSSW